MVIIATASRPQPGHRVLDLEGDLVINHHDIGFTNALATLLPGRCLDLQPSVARPHRRLRPPAATVGKIVGKIVGIDESRLPSPHPASCMLRRGSAERLARVRSTGTVELDGLGVEELSAVQQLAAQQLVNSARTAVTVVIAF